MQNQLTVTGKFLGAKPTQLVGANNYAVRQFFIDLTDNHQYPNTPGMQLRGDKVNLVDNLQKGQTIQVKFNLNGREFTNREGKRDIITNIDVYRIDVVQTQSAAVAQTPARSAAPAAPAPTMSGPGNYAPAAPAGTGSFPAAAPGDGNDDLPF